MAIRAVIFLTTLVGNENTDVSSTVANTTLIYYRWETQLDLSVKPPIILTHPRPIVTTGREWTFILHGNRTQN